MFAFMPFMVFMLKFVRKNDGDIRMDEREDHEALDFKGNDKTPVLYKPLISVTLCGNSRNQISFPMAIYRALRCPLVKSIHYSVSLIFEQISLCSIVRIFLV